MTRKANGTKTKGRANGCGTLEKRKGIYLARWVVDGKRFAKSTGTGDRREAEKVLAELTAPTKTANEKERLENMAARLSGIDAEIKRIIDEAYARAKKILTENKDKLIKVSDYLIEREKLSAEEFDRIMNGEDLEPLDGKENNGGKSDDDGKAASETEVKAEEKAEEKTSETADGKPEDSSDGEE